MIELLVIALVMLVAGLWGGLVNFFLAEPSDENKLSVGRQICIGIAASFMVPLFLNMISGDLIDKIRGVDGKASDYSKLFVLAGFSLVASISSRAFISSLSARILQDVNSAKVKADEAIKEADMATAAVSHLVEEEDEPDDLDALKAASEPMTESDIAKNERDVLNAMVASEYSLRTITGLAKDTKLAKPVVNSTLTSLIRKNLVSQAVNKKGLPRWYPTSEGRKMSVDKPR